MESNYVWIVVLIILLIVLSHLEFIKKIITSLVNNACIIARSSTTRVGGGPFIKDSHIVVDTLNLVHFLYPNKAINKNTIEETIEYATFILKTDYPDRIMYVIKDRTNSFNTQDIRDFYHEIAKKYYIYIYIVEKYMDPPNGVPISNDHSAEGRDDFYSILLAKKYNCPILSNDRMTDFKEFRANMQPFVVHELSYWKDISVMDYIRPESPEYYGMRRPKIHKLYKYFTPMS